MDYIEKNKSLSLCVTSQSSSKGIEKCDSDSERENTGVLVQKIDKCVHSTGNLDILRSLNIEETQTL